MATFIFQEEITIRCLSRPAKSGKSLFSLPLIHLSDIGKKSLLGVKLCLQVVMLLFDVLLVTLPIECVLLFEKFFRYLHALLTVPFYLIVSRISNISAAGDCDNFFLLRSSTSLFQSLLIDFVRLALPVAFLSKLHCLLLI